MIVKGTAERQDAAGAHGEAMAQLHLPSDSVLPRKLRSGEGHLEELVRPEGRWQVSSAESGLSNWKREESHGEKKKVLFWLLPMAPMEFLLDFSYHLLFISPVRNICISLHSEIKIWKPNDTHIPVQRWLKTPYPCTKWNEHAVWMHVEHWVKTEAGFQERLGRSWGNRQGNLEVMRTWPFH